MNLDLLKKLVNLANHNPNENEANAAARRVCRLLEESKFVIEVAPSQSVKQNPFYPKSRTGATVKVTPPKRYNPEEYSKEEKDYDDKINKIWDDLLKDEPR